MEDYSILGDEKRPTSRALKLPSLPPSKAIQSSTTAPSASNQMDVQKQRDKKERTAPKEQNGKSKDSVESRQLKRRQEQTKENRIKRHMDFLEKMKRKRNVASKKSEEETLEEWIDQDVSTSSVSSSTPSDQKITPEEEKQLYDHLKNLSNKSRLELLNILIDFVCPYMTASFIAMKGLSLIGTTMTIGIEKKQIDLWNKSMMLLDCLKIPANETRESPLQKQFLTGQFVQFIHANINVNLAKNVETLGHISCWNVVCRDEVIRVLGKNCLQPSMRSYVIKWCRMKPFISDETILTELIKEHVLVAAAPTQDNLNQQWETCLSSWKSLVVLIRGWISQKKGAMIKTINLFRKLMEWLLQEMKNISQQQQQHQAQIIHQDMMDEEEAEGKENKESVAKQKQKQAVRIESKTNYEHSTYLFTVQLDLLGYLYRECRPSIEEMKTCQVAQIVTNLYHDYPDEKVRELASWIILDSCNNQQYLSLFVQISGFMAGVCKVLAYGNSFHKQCACEILTNIHEKQKGKQTHVWLKKYDVLEKLSDILRSEPDECKQKALFFIRRLCEFYKENNSSDDFDSWSRLLLRWGIASQVSSLSMSKNEQLKELALLIQSYFE